MILRSCYNHTTIILEYLSLDPNKKADDYDDDDDDDDDGILLGCARALFVCSSSRMPKCLLPPQTCARL